MLVLSRKINETLVIGDSIRVTLVSVRGNQVRLGIEAPGDVKVFREEIRPPARDVAAAPCPLSGLDTRRRGRDVPASH